MLTKFIIIFLTFAVSLLAQAADSATDDPLARIIKKNFDEADFLAEKVFPIGFSTDGKKFAFYGQFGKGCKLNKKLNRYFVEDPGPDSDDAISSYSCSPDGVAFFGIINLMTDILVPSEAKLKGDCKGFSGIQTSQKDFKFSDCLGFPLESLQSELKKNAIKPDPELRLKPFPLKTGGFTYTVELICEAAKFKDSKRGSSKTIGNCNRNELEGNYDVIRPRIVLKRSDGKSKTLGFGDDLVAHNFEASVLGYLQAEDRKQIVIEVAESAGDFHGGYTHKKKFFGARLDSRF